MSERLWNISFRPLVWLLLLAIISPGCVQGLPRHQRIEPPPLTDTGLEEYLNKLDSISSIKFLFSIHFKKGDEELKGSASMTIQGEDSELRVYSMGFLISEIRLKNGEITTEGKRISDDKALLLMKALRSCLLWWDIKEREIELSEDLILVRNSWKKVYLDKNHLPLLQEIEFPNLTSPLSEAVRIDYSRPQFYRDAGLWYPSMIYVRLKNNEITLQIERIITSIQN